MFAMEGAEFVQDVVSALNAGMAEYLAAGNHLKGDTTKAHADLDMRLTRVLALGRPGGRERLEVVVTEDQVVGDAEDGGTEGTVAVTNQNPGKAASKCSRI